MRRQTLNRKVIVGTFCPSMYNTSFLFLPRKNLIVLLLSHNLYCSFSYHVVT